jgi:hypothetical protein
MAIVSLDGQLPITASDLEFQLPIAISQLGNLIFDDLTFPAGSYLTLEGVEIEYEKVRLQTVQYTVSQSKNIVRTAVSGRNGSVKEYNNDGDYIIKGQANLDSVLPIFPRDLMQRFADLTKIPQQIPVVSKVLNTFFDIDEVIISEFSLNPGTGAGNATINFTLESDREFDLAEFIITEQ